jgi:importin subunit beta-1
LKIATLRAIGYICETIVRLPCATQPLCPHLVPQKPEVLALRSNEILTAVIHGAPKEEPSSEVQLAAVHAHSLFTDNMLEQQLTFLQ